jgi:hypothetical protein
VTAVPPVGRTTVFDEAPFKMGDTERTLDEEGASRKVGRQLSGKMVVLLVVGVALLILGILVYFYLSMMLPWLGSRIR